MKNGPPREASNPGDTPAFQSREMADHAESSDVAPQALVVWLLLQSLIAAVRLVTASEEAALVRGWCI